MPDQVLVAQPDPEARAALSSIFEARGDTVLATGSLSEAGFLAARQSFDTVVFDLQFFGRSWPDALPKVVQRTPTKRLLFTDSTGGRQLEHPEAYEAWSVLPGPFTGTSVEGALQDAYRRASSSSGGGHGQVSERLKIPIRWKITLPYLFLALLLALAAGYVITRIVFDTIEQRFTNQLIENGRISAEWMVREESRLLENLRLIAHTRGVAEAVRAGDSDALRELLLPVAVNGDVEAVEILDANGVAVLSMRRRSGGGPEDYAFFKGDTSLASIDAVFRVLAGRTDGLGDKYATLASMSWGDYFYVVGPIHDASGNLVGTVLVGESAMTLATGIRQATLAQITLYDSRGLPVATTFLDSVEPVPEDTALTVIHEQEASSYVRSFPILNIDYSEILAPLEVRSGMDIGLIGTSISQTFLVRTSEVTRLQVFAIVALALLLVVAVGLFVSDRITRPLLRVVKAATRVADGDFKVQVHPSGNDEVRALTDSFNAMVRSLDRSQKNLTDAYDRTLEGWAKALELRDEETEGHTRRVTQMTLRLAARMNLTGGRLMQMRRGAMLHDIGKMAVPDAILRKPGPLNDREWSLMHQHPNYANEMLSGISFLKDALEIPMYHHEKWDGTGYPYGLKGEEIPLAARIFAVVDVWDALRSNRPYRPAWREREVLEYIWAGRGTHFDPQVVDLFFEILSEERQRRRGSAAA